MKKALTKDREDIGSGERGCSQQKKLGKWQVGPDGVTHEAGAGCSGSETGPFPSLH